MDPSGLVKGWSIYNAALLLEKEGFKNFYVDAGGDVQVRGKNAAGEAWKVGIRNPFDQTTIVKTLAVTTEGVATSGTYVRGQHIYNPHKKTEQITDIVSLTVIGPNVYEADRFATARHRQSHDARGNRPALPDQRDRADHAARRRSRPLGRTARWRGAEHPRR
ncbi:MAG: hypothetical protein B7X01_00555 [Acidiphilium sp. 21-62-4]|nr:MAG: hypothetical protein B7X01_00555 [Acidiphilium sp. 21-62-4]